MLLVLSVGGTVFADAPGETVLADAGQPRLTIVTAEGASRRIQDAAEKLALYLERMSGARFKLASAEDGPALVVGLAGQFPSAPLDERWQKTPASEREAYQLSSSGDCVYLLGSTELAVEHAVWDFLHQFGYRQFFPGEAWEIVPRRPRLAISIHKFARPDYHSRSIWYGYGPAPYSRDRYTDWCAKNRAVRGISLNTGHAYDGILRRHQTEFQAHPEYLGLVDGKRSSTKFCISNAGLRKLVVDDALEQVDRDPTLDSVSVDPSDGGGWCECADCARLGSISDRAVTLAGAVAAGLAPKHPRVLVGMYAYNFHAPPPSIRVHPNVVISVATAYIKGDYTVEQLIAGWQRQGATIGIREYYGVHPWDRDLPGQARGGDIQYLRKTIPEFYRLGARFLSAESSDNWGPNGLGYYLAARMLWDTSEATRIDALTDDFLEKCFGPAKGPMTEFYRLIDAGRHPLLSDDLVGKMYRRLAEARQLTDDAAIRARLDDLILYTGYVEKWIDYTGAGGSQRQAAFEKLLRYAWRIRERLMIHVVALFRDTPHRDKTVKLPDNAQWQVAAAENPWNQDPPLLRQEIDELLSAGIARRKLLDFSPISFSQNLVPAAPLMLPAVPPGNFGLYTRGVVNYFTFLSDVPATLKFGVTAGIIYPKLSPARLALYPSGEAENKAVAEAEVASDRQPHEIVMQTRYAGLQRLEVVDKTHGTKVDFPVGMPLVVASSAETPANSPGAGRSISTSPRERARSADTRPARVCSSTHAARCGTSSSRPTTISALQFRRGRTARCGNFSIPAARGS